MSLENVKKFNNAITSLLTQLTPNIGVSYKNRFDLIIKSNVVLPIEQFCIHALPIRDKIINKDETYFLGEIENTNLDDTYSINEILNLKNIYSDLDNISKENIWEYFRVMLYLAEEYVKIKYL
jgi:hypothetical protein